MNVKIIWTPRAEETFNVNLDYLQHNWDQHVLNNFLDRVDEVISLIRSDPKMFPLNKSSRIVHKCVVTEQIMLYYKIVKEDKIDLITFWNVYQNPKKLKL